MFIASCEDQGFQRQLAIWGAFTAHILILRCLKTFQRSKYPASESQSLSVSLKLGLQNHYLFCQIPWGKDLLSKGKSFPTEVWAEKDKCWLL